MRFQARVQVETGGKAVDAKSILAVLALGAKGGTALTLSAEGPDAGLALDALAACVAGLVE
jgi:phosphotransferase system HPr (HPr) family protein